ncbi:DNA replication ATP-dependent helicase Dna2 [Ceratobasidium sp. AG-Ba]|nr:DNA replication ATP-dependent helicase Dna2 [Ceratobasidium sp. AG-Ba]
MLDFVFFQDETHFVQAVEGLPPSVPKLKDKASHLTPAQAEFFARWETLIALEEQDMMLCKNDTWTLPKIRRKIRLFVTRAPPVEDVIAPVIDLTTQSEAPKTPQKLRPTSSIIDLTTPSAPRYRIGDQLPYLLKPGLLAFARGYVIEITTDIIVIFDQELPLEGVAIRRHAKTMNGPIAFRIDLDDYSGGMARLRSNLAAMFYNRETSGGCA